VSRVVVNEIQAKVGNDVTFNSNIANPTTVKGEGTATTNLQQGLAKAWVNFDGTASGAAARDGFNNASMTDGGTGIYTLTITNAMNSTNSMIVSGLCTDDGAANNHVANISLLRTSGGSPFTTTTVGFNTVFETSGATLNDMDFVTVAIHGDLA
tara:strand:+ start:155 stop:616 length:462 start_codon:yes stop_codon:yes gene_type:complete